MANKPMAAMITTGIITFGAALATGLFGLLALALALNGFMGQERAVNTSFITYLLLAALVIIVAVVLSVFCTRLAQNRFNWGAVPAVITPVILFSVGSGILHIICVIVAAVVAEQMRTRPPL